jgi:hypothetical protein
MERFDTLENRSIGVADQGSLPQPVFLPLYQDFTIRAVQIVQPCLIALIYR